MSLLSELSRELAALAATGAAGVVGLEHRRGQGSGVVLSPDGYILTNAHVARAAEARCACASGGAVPRRGRARGRGRAHRPRRRADAEPGAPPPLELADSRGLQVGQLVMAIGNPLGFDRSVSLGVVSALFRELPTRDGVLEGLIQTDASVNPGHSGGPLLDMEGRVVGINTAMLTPARGIGFAVPAHTASWVAAVLIQHGEVRRPYLGIRARGEELGPALARDAGPGAGRARGGSRVRHSRRGRRAQRRRPAAGRERRRPSPPWTTSRASSCWRGRPSSTSTCCARASGAA